MLYLPVHWLCCAKQVLFKVIRVFVCVYVFLSVCLPVCAKTAQEGQLMQNADRECASNMALSYSAKGILALNCLGVEHEYDRQTI